ncbi:hypothetical protein [Streptomyces sp. NPDC002394]
MRLLATRRLSALAISAALTLGVAGPAFAGEHRPATAADRTAHAPLPDATALDADSGQLSAADVEALKAQIAAAVEEAKSTATATPPVAGLPVAPPAAAPADVASDTLASVQKAVADLLAAVTSGDAGGVVPTVTSTLTSLVDLVVSTVLGSGSPTLPTLPVTAPELPVAPPVAAPELPVR